METAKLTEKEVAARFEELAAPYFKLLPEVRLRHMDGSWLRIDYLGTPRDPKDFPLLAELVGFEIKVGYEKFGDFSKALKQAIDYRHSIIMDERVHRAYRGDTPRFVFVYPAFGRRFATGALTEGWCGGAVRLAGKYNVGTAGTERNWRGEEVFALRIADTRLWDSEKGPQGSFEKFGSSRGRGSK